MYNNVVCNAMIYNEFLKALEEADIRYVIVGGVAVILHGFVRASMDLDIALSLDPRNLQKFLAVVRALGYRPKAPVLLEDFADPKKREVWRREKNMRVFSLYHGTRYQELIDVLIEDTVPFDELYARRVSIPIGETRVSVVSLNDLKTMKRLAGRAQDLKDIEALEDLERRTP